MGICFLGCLKSLSIPKHNDKLLRVYYLGYDRHLLLDLVVQNCGVLLDDGLCRVSLHIWIILGHCCQRHCDIVRDLWHDTKLKVKIMRKGNAVGGARKFWGLFQKVDRPLLRPARILYRDPQMLLARSLLASTKRPSFIRSFAYTAASRNAQGMNRIHSRCYCQETYIRLWQIPVAAALHRHHSDNHHRYPKEQC